MNSEKREEPIEAEVIDVVSEKNEEKKKHIYPNFADIAAIFGVMVISQLVGVLMFKPLMPYLFGSVAGVFENAMLMLLVQIFSMVLTIIFIIVMRRRANAPSAPIKFSFKGFNPIILLSGIVMILSTSVVVEPLLALLPPPPAMDARGWPLLVAVVIAAPFFEEIICRGMIYESLRAKGGVLTAWLFSSLFFGLIHLDPTMSVNAFFMGLVLCYIYIRSKSIIAPMILHAVNNAISYTFIVFGVGGDDGNVMLRDLISSDSIYYVVYGVAVLILIVSIVMCSRQFKKIIEAKEADANADLAEVQDEESK